MLKLAAIATSLFFAAGAASAQAKEQDHQAHHPDGAASSALKAPAKAATPAPAKNADMAAKMKAMQDMHQKMMNAKTPEERQVLMAEHMKSMQAGMGVMKQMSADPKARMEAMEQRMDMMQMMMDRMPASPAPTGK
ncbi:hypothetical protein J7U46_19365 [Pelomonas sp. V22]|uniref:hypothetical protein n=1 Tax=Pelomonas sp. V22 TaxID=2822139 RepID=UPI0024A9E8B3|nr:hypothetical protein [Pelomonas sp. V22]MDI4635231.1 hypothetical protein [Pelomonas sp. V22]